MDDKHPSLHPPLHGYYPANEAPGTSWVLLDLHAYIADRENATSAHGRTSDGTLVRVTLSAAAPPLVSYVCVWCPSLRPSQIGLRATVEAAESDLLLLEVSLHARRTTDYFVYKADAGGGRGPSLRPLQVPEPCLDYRYHIALLAHRDVRPQGHGEGDFYVAALINESSRGSERCFVLWVLDSKEGRWSSRTVTVHCPLYHLTCKAINLGEGGLVGFIDPWRGTVVCDVLGRRPPRYLPMPQELFRNDTFRNEPLLSRDIALVGGRLTLVDMLVSTEPDNINLNCWNWEVSTWSRKVSELWEEDWRNDYSVQSPDIAVGTDADNVDLLPKLKDNQGTLRPTLGMRHVAHPTLSLTDSHVVYIMAKLGRRDEKALVLSIDMKKPRLQGVAMFDAERMLGIAFSYTYTQSWIPKYLSPGVERNLKRSGMFDVPYPRKLHDRNNVMYDDTYMQLSGGVQEEHGTGASMEAEDENNIMDLD